MTPRTKTAIGEDGGQRHPQAQSIDPHVARIGEQGQRPGEEPTDDLHQHESENQNQARSQSSQILGPPLPVTTGVFRHSQQTYQLRQTNR
jgi:hypothetical protein